MISSSVENAEMLAEMQQAGMDLSLVHDVDFFFNFTKKKDAEKMWREVEADVGDSNLSLNETDIKDGWILCCTVAMIPTNEAITKTEIEFDDIAKKFQGESDGWGVLQGGGAQ